MEEFTEFREFIYNALITGIHPDLARRLVEDDPLRFFFVRAFTHNTFLSGVKTVGKSQQPMDYEVLEKVGDAILGGCLQLYLFEVMGNEIHVPQVYSDMQKRFEGQEVLSEIVESMGFDRYIRIADKNNIMTTKIKSDVFESFVGAIVIAADRYIPEARSIGFALAKDWLFQVFNTYIRDQVDPTNQREFVDYVTRVNEIWTFNGWGPLNFVTKTGQGLIQSSINLIAPTHHSFPDNLKGKVLGTGTGPTAKVAKENAARDGLERLNVNFPELKNNETIFSKLAMDRLERKLGSDSQLFIRVKSMLENNPEKTISVRTLRIYGYFYAQIRERGSDMIWRTGEKTKSEISEQDAINIVFTKFLEKTGF